MSKFIDDETFQKLLERGYSVKTNPLLGGGELVEINSAHTQRGYYFDEPSRDPVRRDIIISNNEDMEKEIRNLANYYY